MAKDQFLLRLEFFLIFFDMTTMNLMIRIQKRIIEHEIKKLKHDLYTLEE